MISVRTMPEAGPPMRRRAWVSASWMAPVVVSVRAIVIAASSLGRFAPLQTPPCAPVPCHHRLGRARALRTRRILLRLGVRGPEILDRVDDPPAQLHLLLPGGPRRGAGGGV